MDLFIWDKKFELGIASIDLQHKKLVELVNKLYEAMQSGKGITVLGEILKELADYTVYHFGHEEKIFQSTLYPQASTHALEHKALTDKVAGYVTTFQKSGVGLSIEVLNFLSDWIKKHIQETDRAYVAHFKDKGIN